MSDDEVIRRVVSFNEALRILNQELGYRGGNEKLMNYVHNLQVIALHTGAEFVGDELPNTIKSVVKTGLERYRKKDGVENLITELKPKLKDERYLEQLEPILKDTTIRISIEQHGKEALTEINGNILLKQIEIFSELLSQILSVDPSRGRS